MNIYPFRSLLGRFVAAVVLLAPAVVSAEVDPAADQVLDRFVAAIGGEKALQAIDSRVLKISISVPAAGMTLEAVSYQKEPDLYLMEQTVPGMGVIVMGYDGKTAWSLNPMQGYRELEGLEKQQVLMSSDLRSEVNLKQRYPHRARLPDRTSNGRTLHVVAMTGGDVPPSTMLFDAETHLLVEMELTVDAGEQGEFPLRMELGDYREVGGIKIAHRMTNHMLPMEMVMTMTEVQQNVPLEDSLFAPRRR